VLQTVTAVLQMLVTVLTIGAFVDRIRAEMDKPSPNFNSVNSSTQFLYTPLSLLSIAALIGVMIWSYRAATSANHLNYPHVRGPVWAIVGWIIPIVNFWFPYVAVRDALPPGHPARSTVLRWWLCYLGMSFGAIGLALVAVFSDMAIAVALAIPVLIVAATGLLAALEMVDAITADHLRQVGMSIDAPPDAADR
jgi:hypothetical protein